MKIIEEIGISSMIRAEKAYDPDDPNADTEGYVWVISVSLYEGAGKLYLCDDGYIR
jgi:flagellar basal body rod protein FlgC